MRRSLLALGFVVAQVGQIPDWPTAFHNAASSATVQVLTSTSNSAVSNAGNRFWAAGYVSSIVGSDFASMVFPVAGTIGNIRAFAATTPSGAATWKASVNVGGSTVITCTIDSTHNPCNSATTSAVSAGNTADVETSPTSSPTSAAISIAFDFVPTVAGDTILPARVSAVSASTVEAEQLFSGVAAGLIASRQFTIMPEAGTVDQLNVVSGAPGGSASYNFSMYKVTTDQGFTCTVTGAGTTCSDTSTSFTNASGNPVTFNSTPTATPASVAVAFGSRWRSSVKTSDFLLINGNDTAQNSASATTYFCPTGGSSTTESLAQCVVNNMTVSSILVTLSVAPGSGKSRTYTLDDNGSGVGNCTVSNTATTCTITGPISISDGDLLDVSDAPTGTPATSVVSIGVVAHR